MTDPPLPVVHRRAEQPWYRGYEYPTHEEWRAWLAASGIAYEPRVLGDYSYGFMVQTPAGNVVVHSEWGYVGGISEEGQPEVSLVTPEGQALLARITSMLPPKL